MKTKIRNIIRAAAIEAYHLKEFSSAQFPEIEIDEPKLELHGDYSTNFAMMMAKIQKLPPRKIAEILIIYMKNLIEEDFAEVEIAGPGFINFRIAPIFWHPILKQIHEQKDQFGSSDIGKGERVQVEFVSANPTGPLHVGHGRGAAVGDAVANILNFCGYNVQKEYYINDSGRQIRTLGSSVFYRYKEAMGEAIDFPSDCYQGDYIIDLAKEMIAIEKDALLACPEEEAILKCARFAADTILAGIRNDLESFNVSFDNWYSEQSLYNSKKVDQALKDFKQTQIVYESDKAFWFKSTQFGDEKDRVVVRANGQTTYFASDIAYHQHKFQRGFTRVIDVWGADHHGYINRIKACVEASGYRRNQFQVILVQLVNLVRAGEPVAMSTRSGEFVTLRDVINEVGKDAARFLFLSRHYESPLEFDLELAKKKSNDNPVYYVQYVHARIASIMRKAFEQEPHNIECLDEFTALLTHPDDIRLIKSMYRYQDIIKASANHLEPHRITFYLMDLASSFHSYYNKHRILTDDPKLTQARLILVIAVKIIIQNGLNLLGVAAPEKM